MPRIRFTVAALAAALLLSGCTPSAPATPRPAPSRTAVPASATTPVPSVAPTAAAPTQDPAAATAVSVKCSTLVPKAVLATLGKRFTRVKPYEPAADDDAAKLVALGGSVCDWQDPDSGRTLEVAVAEPSSKDADGLKDDLVEHSNSVPTYGVEAYFQTVEGFGLVDAFPGDHWLYARSDAFYEPGDASAVVKAAIKALKSAG